MILNPFSYSAPQTIQEAVSLLSESGSEVFTGDQAYVGRAKKGIFKPSALVSLRNVPGLKFVNNSGDHLEIGSAVSFGEMLADSVVCSIAVLLDALKTIKDPHLRNHSNVGGALYLNSDTHGPLLAAFLTLNGKVNITGPQGERQVLLETYLSNGIAATLAKGEIIRSVVLNTTNSASGSFHFIDYLKAGKIVCGAAVLIDKDKNTISKIHIAVSGCVKVPIRLSALEESLTGKEITKENIETALRGLSPDDLAISNDSIPNPSYLLHLLKVLIKRAVLKS